MQSKWLPRHIVLVGWLVSHTVLGDKRLHPWRVGLPQAPTHLLNDTLPIDPVALTPRLLLVHAGDNTVLLQQVAAMLLKRYKESFRGGSVAATWTYLRAWALGALPPNPLTSHDTGPRHLRDPAFLKRALRWTNCQQSSIFVP